MGQSMNEIMGIKSIQELETEILQKIVSSWKKIVVACVFMAFSALVLGAVVVGSFGSKNEGSILVIVFAMQAFLNIIAIIGVILRQSWGRWLGQLVCVFLLFAFPIGTIFGVVGLIGFDGAKLLFNGSKVTVSEVKAELHSRAA